MCVQFRYVGCSVRACTDLFGWMSGWGAGTGPLPSDHLWGQTPGPSINTANRHPPEGGQRVFCLLSKSLANHVRSHPRKIENDSGPLVYSCRHGQGGVRRSRANSLFPIPPKKHVFFINPTNNPTKNPTKKFKKKIKNKNLKKIQKKNQKKNQKKYSNCFQNNKFALIGLTEFFFCGLP